MLFLEFRNEMFSINCSYLLVKPPQVKMGTWSVREAMGWNSWPGKTWKPNHWLTRIAQGFVAQAIPLIQWRQSYEIIINFVRDDGHVVSGCHLQDVDQVSSTVDRSARVRRIVDDNGCGLVIDLRFQFLQVNLPAAFRLLINVKTR